MYVSRLFQKTVWFWPSFPSATSQDPIQRCSTVYLRWDHQELQVYALPLVSLLGTYFLLHPELYPYCSGSLSRSTCLLHAKRCRTFSVPKLLMACSPDSIQLKFIKHGKSICTQAVQGSAGLSCSKLQHMLRRGLCPWLALGLQRLEDQMTTCK